MISRLEIKGFKTLVDVSIDLGAVNVFIGANGSGKSNLLEAVGALSAIASGNIAEESLRYRGLRQSHPAGYCTSLKDVNNRAVYLNADNQETSYRTGISPNLYAFTRWDLIAEDVEFDGKKLIQREKDGVRIYHPDGFYAKFPYNSDARSDARTSISLSRLGFETALDGTFVIHGGADKSAAENQSRKAIDFLDMLTAFAIFSPTTPQLRGFLDDIRREPLGLGGSGLGQAIDAMLKGESDKLGPFDLDDVFELIDWADSLITDAEGESGLSKTGGPICLRIGDRTMAEPHRSVSLLEASEGALYVLFLLALVGHQESPKFFAVDNFDQALHPRLARALTQLITDQILADGTRQMLATTHNPLVLDGLDLLDDRVRLFTVDRDAQGASQVQRVVVTEELIEKGFSLSRLWTSGRLGGVPASL